MSYEAEGYYVAYREIVRRARKLHTCDACEQPIRPGDYYCAVSWVFDGGADGVKRCGSCQRTHEHLRNLCWYKDRGYHDHLWPDERLRCGREYEDEWGDAPPDEIAALPLLSAAERGALLVPRVPR